MTIAWTGWYTDAEPGIARGGGTGTRNYQAGCTKAGPECDHCYAELMSARIARSINRDGQKRGPVGELVIGGIA